MAADVINLARASRPDVSEKQREFAKSLIGLGLSRLCITALVLGKDAANLSHADIATGNRLISKLYKELGHNLLDARNGRSEFMNAAIANAAKSLRIKIRIA